MAKAKKNKSSADRSIAQKGAGKTKSQTKSHARAEVNGQSKPSPKSKSKAKRRAVKQNKQPVQEKRSFGSRLKRWLFKWVMIVVFLVCIFPVILTLLYWPGFVHPISTLMISKWYQGESVSRTWVAFDDITPSVYQSVISSEDGRFCFHNGVDWDAVNIVIDDLMEGERPRGASTIPMQTVKNVYLWPSRSYVRKVMEVPLALLTDAIWSKRRMMEIYLNIAEWGPGIYGIEAAAQHHFKRSAKKLTRRQAALLAVTLPNPKLRNPRKPKRGMNRLAKLVEKRAKASGAYIRCLTE